MFGITQQKIEKWKSKNDAEKIIKAMNNKDKAIRLSAIKATADMKGDSIYNELVMFLKDQDSDIRGSAVDALGEFGRQSAQDHLKHISENDSDENVRKKALKAMKTIISKKAKLG